MDCDIYCVIIVSVTKITVNTYYGVNRVGWVSAHGRLNITRNFGPHGCLPGIYMYMYLPYVYIEAATLTP
jgi:hypothetical protein